MQIQGHEKRIYEIIIDDISRSKNGYSTITNAQVWKILALDYSPNSVRDKVQRLIKKGYLKGKYDLFIDNGYHNRVLYVGNIKP
jgi:hypothetical protein